MIGISDSVMSLGYKTNMAFNTSVNLKNTQNHCHVDVIHCDRSLYEKVFVSGIIRQYSPSLRQIIVLV